MDVTDPSDWPVIHLAEMDNHLRCPICKDFFTAPVSVKCGHSFCSLCIRRSLVHEKKCPACRADADESTIRLNATLGEVTTLFQKSRPVVLEAFKRPEGSSTTIPSSPTSSSPLPTRETRSSKRKRADLDKESSTSPLQSQTSTVDVATQTSQQQELAQTTTSTPVSSDIKPDTVLACPICGRSMRYAVLNSHLDSCNGDPNPHPGDTTSPTFFRPSTNTNSTTPTTRTNQSPRLPSPPRQVKKMPTLSYGLMNDVQLRRKCAEAGISSLGDRKLLTDRHKQFTLIHNANSDAVRPQPNNALFRQLDEWERVHVSRRPVQAEDTDMPHQTKYKDEFDELVRQAKESRRKVSVTNGSATNGTKEDERDAFRNHSPVKDITMRDGIISRDGINLRDELITRDDAVVIAESP